ncbi:hypothetical protein SDC9_91049 [bioreactor metagenome]|uniref:Uncharacterized protein n=1 Tax=bioreactor metagenome TaxID=1076179 RepID=A0A644ZWR6_9ZZZZ
MLQFTLTAGQIKIGIDALHHQGLTGQVQPHLIARMVRGGYKEYRHPACAFFRRKENAGDGIMVGFRDLLKISQRLGYLVDLTLPTPRHSSQMPRAEHRHRPTQHLASLPFGRVGMYGAFSPEGLACFLHGRHRREDLSLRVGDQSKAGEERHQQPKRISYGRPGLTCVFELPGGQPATLG